MDALTAEQLRGLYEAVLQPDKRKILRAHPATAWMEAELETRLAGLSTHLVGRPDDDAIVRASKRTGEADVVHDDSHRHFRGLIACGLHRGTPEQRTAVATLLAVLYPSGLRTIQLSYRDEVAASQSFADRLERDDVQAGLAAVGEYAKNVKGIARDCVKAGQALGEALDALEQAEAAAVARPNDRALFDARTAAYQTWSTFVTVVEHALQDSAPETIEQREALLGRWRAYREHARRGPGQPAAPTEPVAPVPAEPEPV